MASSSGIANVLSLEDNVSFTMVTSIQYTDRQSNRCQNSHSVVSDCSQIVHKSFRDWSLITGRGLQNGRGVHVKFYP